MNDDSGAIERTIREVYGDFVAKIKPTCPWCGSDSIAAEFVDVGVGEQQVSPYECHDCGAAQIGPHHDPETLAKATDEENGKGWWRGWEHRDALEPTPADPKPRVRCRDCLATKAECVAQEKRFKKASADFQAAASRLRNANAQQTRVIEQLRVDQRMLREDLEQRIEQRLSQQRQQRLELQQERDAARKEAADARAELERIKATIKTPEPDGRSRVSLLEID